MSLSATLTDLTGDLKSCTQIPAHLARFLDLEPLTLAIVRLQRAPGGITTPSILLHASAGGIATGENAAHFPVAILEVYRSTRPLPAGDSLPLRPAPVYLDASHELIETAIREHPAFGRQVVALKTIDADHRLMLIVHRRGDLPTQANTTFEMLMLAANMLARLLRVPLETYSHPESLGTPFDRLTDREWVVLRSLNSDDGEKQLADRLALSPHTLHSHIKSIYRKVGVQGRLPLLLKYNAALRELRLVTLLPQRTFAHAAVTG